MCNNSLLPLMPPSSTTQQHTGPIYIPTIFFSLFFFSNRSTKSSTSRQQSDLYAQQPVRRWLLIFGDMLKPWLACFPPHGQPAASRPNCVTTTICSAAFLWCYPCRGFHMFTPQKTSRSVPIHLSFNSWLHVLSNFYAHSS